MYYLGANSQTNATQTGVALNDRIIIGVSIAGGVLGLFLLIVLPIGIVYMANNLCCPHAELFTIQLDNTELGPAGHAGPTPAPSCAPGGMCR